MSGGSMEFVYYRIQEAAGYIQRELANLELQKRNGVKADRPAGYYADEHPDDPRMKDGEKLRNAVIRHMRNALKVCRQAAIYAERVEWLTSGDDGYEAFVLRTEEELAKCKRQGGVE